MFDVLSLAAATVGVALAFTIAGAIWDKHVSAKRTDRSDGAATFERAERPGSVPPPRKDTDDRITAQLAR